MEYPTETNPARQELLRLVNINLSFGSIVALKNVDFCIAVGEVHAIVGEHGAGKSSLANVMSGVVLPNSGEILFEGNALRSFPRAQFIKVGIDAVFQQPQVHPNYTVAENLFASGITKGTSLFYNSGFQKKLAATYLCEHNFDLDPTVLVDQLSLSQQTLVAVLRALYSPPKLLIIDEALDRMESPDRRRIISMLARLNEKGMAIVLITHTIDDVYGLADRVSIIREGRVLLTQGVSEIDKISLIRIAYTEMLEAGIGFRFNKDFYEMLKYIEAIIKKLPSTLLVVDNDKRVKMLNDHAKAWFKVQLGLHPSIPLDDLFDAREATILELLYKAMAKKKETRHYNLHFEHRKIRTIADITVFPILEAAQILGYIIIIQDVTEREKLLEQVALSQNLASVGLLAAGVAHEINNPLGTIANHLEALKYVRCADPTLQELRENIQDQFNYIGSIVENLVSFSAVDKAIEEEVDIGDTVRTIIRLIKMEAERRRIAINVDSGKKPSIVRINQNEMKQVLLNLFKNSFEAMPEGGNISIAISQVRAEDGWTVHVRFADTGCGLRCENPTEVFLPFYTTKKVLGKNLGLGLSISYNIINKYGGQISARNKKDCGCEFDISLPCREK